MFCYEHVMKEILWRKTLRKNNFQYSKFNITVTEFLPNPSFLSRKYDISVTRLNRYEFQ